MKHFLVISVLCLVAACAGPQLQPAARATARAPHPQPSSTTLPEAMRSTPPECRVCAAEVRRRLASCGSASGSCMSRCSGSDAMRTALCQSDCQGIYASCAQAASVPNDCPAYCAL
jgi:hypothetical protein